MTEIVLLRQGMSSTECWTRYIHRVHVSCYICCMFNNVLSFLIAWTRFIILTFQSVLFQLCSEWCFDLFTASRVNICIISDFEPSKCCVFVYNELNLSLRCKNSQESSNCMVSIPQHGIKFLALTYGNHNKFCCQNYVWRFFLKKRLPQSAGFHLSLRYHITDLTEEYTHEHVCTSEIFRGLDYVEQELWSWLAVGPFNLKWLVVQEVYMEEANTCLEICFLELLY